MNNKDLEVFLKKEFDWLNDLIEQRLNDYFEIQKHKTTEAFNLPMVDGTSTYELFLKNYNLGASERVVLALFLAAVLKPDLLDVFLIENGITNKPFSHIGGEIKNGSFKPSYRTAAFLIDATANVGPLSLVPMFKKEHSFSKHDLLVFPDAPFSEKLDALIKLSSKAENAIFC